MLTVSMGGTPMLTSDIFFFNFDQSVSKSVSLRGLLSNIVVWIVRSDMTMDVKH